MTRIHTGNLNDFLHSLKPFTVGMDRMFGDLEQFSNTFAGSSTSYPPYNIEETDPGKWLISIAIAGFGEDDIKVTQTERTLSVKGNANAHGHKENLHAAQFKYHGIANRSFDRSFRLGPHVQVKNANLKNGMLSIELEQELPEEEKPKEIPIVVN
jgi:molecular chaperone IbpA|tara:strand:+ start:293 stop:757 length:465 start_codon:yes stop_codon:yes gene_type:complete